MNWKIHINVCKNRQMGYIYTDKLEDVLELIDNDVGDYIEIERDDNDEEEELLDTKEIEKDKNEGNVD